MTMRSTLGRVRGLGPAQGGVADWWGQRVTAAALVPLAAWFVIALLAHFGEGAPQTAAWLAGPWNAVLLLALLIALFRHLALGLQVVIEDYIQGEPARLAAVLGMKAVLGLFWLAGMVAVLKLTFRG